MAMLDYLITGRYIIVLKGVVLVELITPLLKDVFCIAVFFRLRR